MSWLAAAASLASTAAGVANTVSTGKLNKKNRRWQEDMWNKTNEYNSPIMQMQRFKDAGLNPHLIYGQGNNGNASMASAPDQKLPDYSPFPQAISNYVATRKQQTEVNNLEKASQVMDADIGLKQAQAAAQLSNSAKTDLDRKLATDLYQTTIQQNQQNLRNSALTGQNIQAQIESTLEGTRLTKAQQKKISQEMVESAARVQNLEKDGKLKDADTELKRIETTMRRNGINPSDPAWMRILTQMFAPNAKDIGDTVKNPLDTGYKAGQKTGRWLRDRFKGYYNNYIKP